MREPVEQSPRTDPAGMRKETQMEDSAYGHVRTVILTLVAGASLGGGCVDPGIDCWTRERYRAAAYSPMGPIGEIRAGTYRGEVVTEDPGNWWTNARFTGKPCRIQVEHRSDGTYTHTHFMDAAVRLQARIGPGDSPFFSGETADGKAVVLQHHLGRPISLTLTHYEADGTLSYGACGEWDAPYLECHGSRE